MRALSLDRARRLALAAQGFTDEAPRGRVDARHIRRVFRRVGLVQIDSVNVLERAHYLPFFSRLGPYRKGILDDLAYRRRELFEYWGHEASLIPVGDHALYRDRMRSWVSARAEQLAADEPGYLEQVLAEIRARGPLLPSELSDPGDGRGAWWGWNKGKIACEYLFARGHLAVAGRRQFARLYDLAERVLPAAVLAEPTPEPEAAHRALVLAAARHQGVATIADLADYHRLPVTTVRRVAAELAAEGLLEPVDVAGWNEPALRDPDAAVPRRVAARALLAPFDPLVWHRPRLERLFGFRYRLEIYTPASARVHGYYVLPFLLGDRLVARVDLKADRRAGALRVRAAWIEPAAGAEAVGPELAAELVSMARWLDLETVTVERRGDLAAVLRRACRSARV
jgi:uncharacterized protein